MKILLITGGLNWGGTAQALVGYALILKAKHKVLVWGCKSEGELAGLLRSRGIAVCIGADAAEQARAFRPDIINFHQPGTFSNAEVISFMRELRTWRARIVETNVFGRPVPEFRGLVDLSIQVSKWDLWQWNRWKGRNYGIPGVYCPNPVDCDLYKRISDEEIGEVRQSWGIPEWALVVGRIGNTNWETLATPMQESLERIKNVHFVIVADRKCLLPQSLLNHPRVHMVPRLHGASELCRFYSSCDVMVSMSAIGESFGYVNAEAMACGTPVIALSTPLHCNAQSEVVSPGEGGYTIACPDLFPDALERFFWKTDRAAMAQCVRELIVERYSYPVCAKILDGIFIEDLGQLDGLRDVDAKWIRRLLGGAIGRYGIVQRAVFPFYYSRLGYLLMTFAKTRLAVFFKLIRKMLMQ